MRGFRKYILPGNEIQPGVWEAEESEGLAKEYRHLDTIEVCEHRDLALVHQNANEIGIEVYFTFKEESKCPRCKGVLKDGRWQI